MCHKRSLSLVLHQKLIRTYNFHPSSQSFRLSQVRNLSLLWAPIDQNLVWHRFMSLVSQTDSALCYLKPANTALLPHSQTATIVEPTCHHDLLSSLAKLIPGSTSNTNTLAQNHNNLENQLIILNYTSSVRQCYLILRSNFLPASTKLNVPSEWPSR